MFTDYAANTSIIKQMIFANNNIDKLNFRLVRAFIYFSQFRLNFKYRPGKKHVIPDAFSRLSFGNGPVNFKLPRVFPADSLNLNTYFCGTKNPSENPNWYIFRKKYINMSEEFKQQIINGYDQKNIWNKLKSMFKSLAERSRREKNSFFVNIKNILIKNEVTPITQVAVTENDEPNGERVFTFLKL